MTPTESKPAERPPPRGWASWDQLIAAYDKAIRERITWTIREEQLRGLLQEGCDACEAVEPAKGEK